MSLYERWSLWWQAFTALGTVGAVVTALYFSYIRENPQIKVTVDLIISPSHISKSKVVYVGATNFGNCQERVEQYGYCVGFPQLIPLLNMANFHDVEPEQAALCGDKSIFSGHKRFFSTLSPCETASSILEIDKFNERHLDFFFESLRNNKFPKFIRNNSTFQKILLWTSTCWVSTARKSPAKGRLRPNLRKYIWDEYMKQKSGDQPED